MKAPLQTGVLSPPCPGHHSGGDTVGTLGLLIKVDLLEGSGGPYPRFSPPHPKHSTLPSCRHGVRGGSSLRRSRVPHTPGGPPACCPQHTRVPELRQRVGPPDRILLAREQQSPPKGCPGRRVLCCPQAGARGSPPETEGPSWHPPRDVVLTTRAR